MAYNSAWQPTGFNYGNGVAASFGYNSRMQLASLAYTKSGSALFSLNYDYITGVPGNNGQIQKITDNVDATRTSTIVYDGWLRLKSWTNPQATVTEAYDRYGNRLTQSLPVPSTVAVDATTNRITTAGFMYDANGNMTNDSINTLTYDGENRVVTSTQAGATYNYSYDGNGLRVKRTPPAGSATVYIFSGSKVIAEYASGAAPNSPSSEYIYSAGQLVATLAGSATTYHHPDQLSTRISTDSNGNTARAFGHYPFGETWYETGTASKWKFTSYERDAESLNDYAFARTYVNRLARFSSTDPLTGSLDNPQATNRYAYAINDPINLNDSLGLGLCPPYTICVDAWGHPWPSGGGVTVGGGSGGVTGGGGGNPKTIEQSGPGDGGNSSGDRSNPYVDRKALADCISTLFPGVTLADFEESTPGVKGSFTGFGPDLRTNHGNTGPIVVVNDAATYNAAQIAAIAGKPNAIGFTDPRRPYENYGNNNNNLIGTIVNQVHELGHSLFSITQTLSPLVPEPQEMGSALENCVRQHHGFVRH